MHMLQLDACRHVAKNEIEPLASLQQVESSKEVQE